MKIFSRILTSIALILLSLPALNAQSAITKVVDNIEKQNNVEYVTYTERRDPKTHKVYRASKVILIKNPVEQRRIIDAFNKDRKNASSYEMSRNRVYKIRFDGDKERQTYTLVIRGKDHAVLTIDIRTEGSENWGCEPDADISTVNDMACLNLDLSELDLSGLNIPEINIPPINIPEINVSIPEIRIPQVSVKKSKTKGNCTSTSTITIVQ